ncbi:hypothetical protein ACQ4M4_16780 [Leptolyngbya sp. AN02str]|uniref:hypothetical protein n=1 Tax=Leptolyngbya sp. AN02str TaxID=3423363 RepID=UPI003D312C67
MRTPSEYWGERRMSSRLDATPTPSQAMSKASQWLSKFSQTMVTRLAGTQEPQISQKRDRNGGVSWVVYDPLTSETLYFSSEAEVRMWLEQRYQF